MILLSTIIRLFEAELLAQYQDSLLPSHFKALDAMKACRTAASPSMLAQCRACDHRVLVPHSCGHRSCPHCQNHESQQWLERQLQKLVPGTYFLVTFTLPPALRALAFGAQRTLYTLMIRCAWQTVHSFAHNDKQLQGTPGAIAVLHTHSRRLDYHPHVHLVVPAAAIDAKKRLWRTKKAKGKCRYLFNHKALAKVFRAKLLDAITNEGLPLPERDAQKWVVDCQCVGAGEKALVYLGRYLYRGVIREKDILACENGQVTFRYKNAKTKRSETRTVSGAKFLWLILQHVLPKGFRRARNFGFLHPNSKRLIALLQVLFAVDPTRAVARIKPRPPLACPCCGGDMKIVKTRIISSLSGPPPVPIGDAAVAIM
ncbi:MAG: IS91 family transposase [Chromatiaceae bacterium]